MRNPKSLEQIDPVFFSSCFRKPQYTGYSFYQILPTVAKLLGVDTLGEGLPKEALCNDTEGYADVVLLLLDGFGYHLFEKYAHLECLKELERNTHLSKLSTLFPSTTAVHITYMSSGLLPLQTGIYEWFYYEPIVDAIIAPLLYSHGGSHKTESLKDLDVSPQDIYPQKTIYEVFANSGIESYLFYDESIVNSTYSQTLGRKAHRCSFKTINEGYERLLDILTTPATKKRYFFLYCGEIDAAGHRHSTDDPLYKEALEKNIQEVLSFMKKLPSHRKIAFIITADHGMVNLDPKKTIYLNKTIPELPSYIERSPSGVLKAPCGSCRDFFLPIKPEKKEEVKALLEKHLKGKAEVFYTQDLIQAGIFGPIEPSERFLKRIGNLTVLPYEKEGVFWYEKGHYEQHFFGVHGGMSPQEVETLFFYKSYK